MRDDPELDRERARLEQLVDDVEWPPAPTVPELSARVRRRHRRRVGVVASATAVATLVVVLLLVGTTPFDRNPGVEVAARAPVAHPIDHSEWVWWSTDRVVSRDGTPSGFATRLVPDATGLVIVLGDGTPCLTPDTCGESTRSFDAGDFATVLDGSPDRQVLSPQDLVSPDSPFEDRNLVWIPHVTGDFHLGSDASADIEGVDETQHAVGHTNVSAVLDELTGQDWFDDATDVTLVGSGAGGFGAVATYPSVSDTFDDVDVSLLVDSAPFFLTGEVFRPCQAWRWISTWDLSRPTGWPDDISSGRDAIGSVYEYLADRYPAAQFGFLASRDDEPTRRLYALDSPDCPSSQPLVDSATYADAIDELAARLDTLAPWSVLIVDADDGRPLPGLVTPGESSETREQVRRFVTSITG